MVPDVHGEGKGVYVSGLEGWFRASLSTSVLLCEPSHGPLGGIDKLLTVPHARGFPNGLCRKISL